jgi:hypothetical protein
MEIIKTISLTSKISGKRPIIAYKNAVFEYEKRRFSFNRLRKRLKTG